MRPGVVLEAGGEVIQPLVPVPDLSYDSLDRPHSRPATTAGQVPEVLGGQQEAGHQQEGEEAVFSPLEVSQRHVRSLQQLPVQG